MRRSSTGRSRFLPRTGRLPLAALLLAIAAPVAAQASAAPPPYSSAVIYDADALSNVSGGVRRGSEYQGMLRWQAGVDGERLAGWSDSSAYFNLMALHHAGPVVLTGDAQGVSNMAGPSGVRLEEAWVQQNFFDGHLSVLAGRYDLNSEFYRLNSTGLFLNSSFGIGAEFAQSGQGGPSIFPATAVGARIAVKPAADLVMRLAVLDGVPVDRGGGGSAAFRGGDGVLIVYEVASLNRPAIGGPPQDRHLRIGRNAGLAADRDKFALGAWYYTAQFADLSALDAQGRPRQRRGAGGAYAVAERTLYQSATPAQPVQAQAGTAEPAQPQQTVSGFLQFGVADRRVNRFQHYLGAGLTATGFVPGRASDELGLAVAIARNGNPYLYQQQLLGAAAQRAETAVELTYLAQLSQRLSLQPSVQYVIHPNTLSAVSNAWTLQVRAEMAF